MVPDFRNNITYVRKYTNMNDEKKMIQFKVTNCEQNKMLNIFLNTRLRNKNNEIFKREAKKNCHKIILHKNYILCVFVCRRLWNNNKTNFSE